MAGATLPLEEIVSFGLAAVGSVAGVLTAGAGSTGCSLWEAAISAATAGWVLESSATLTAGFAGDTASGAEGSASAFAATFLVSVFVATGLGGSGSLGSGSTTTTGSGGGGGFSRPSRSALRRTRSA